MLSIDAVSKASYRHSTILRISKLSYRFLCIIALHYFHL